MLLIISPCPNCGMLVQNARYMFYAKPGETTIKAEILIPPTRGVYVDLAVRIQTGALFACRCGAHWAVEQYNRYDLGPIRLQPQPEEG